ncbi:uncharacterized protein [Periplaneta americana]|uniref:uncharacterized protein n=1 Tax=Periplaneta americana TaxID=6978 RepID=UPI0037E7A5CB
MDGSEANNLATVEVPTMQIRYKKEKGFANGRGLEYEIKIAALLFLRALQQTQHFYIATNMSGAGAFDDVVIAYKIEGSEQWKSCFIQLKHKTSRKAITVQRLTNFIGNEEFYLGKYSQSYTKIKKRFEAVGSEDPVFGGDFRDSEYIIYTNATMDDELCKRERQTHSNIRPLLQTNEEPGSVFSFCDVSDQDIYSYFNDLLKVKEFLKSQKLGSISDEEFHIAVEQFKISLTSKLPEMIELGFRKENTAKMRLVLNDLEDCNDFLRNMSFFIKQLNEKQVENIILTEIQKIFCTDFDETECIWNKIYGAVSHWWKEEDYYLTETTPFWQEIIESRLQKLSQRKQKEINELGISFQNITLQASINTPELNIVTKSPLLTCSKVCQTLETPHIVMGLQSVVTLKREVLALWPSKWCTTMVVEWEQVEQSVEFLYFQHPQRRLIIVSRQPVQCDEHVTDVTNFSDIDERSQHMIGEKEITLQGYKVRIKSLLTDERKLLMNEDILLQILISNEITVGNIIRTLEVEYISRTLSHFIYLKETFLNNNKVSDVVAISGVHKEDIPRLSSGDESCTYFAIDGNNYDSVRTHSAESNNSLRTEREVDPNLCRFTIIRNSTEFNKLCEKCPNVHWIELQADKKLVWKQSKGDISEVQKYINKSESVFYEQEKILTAPDRAILIIAEPGMGKSTLVSQISTTLKQIHRTKWVILVTLNDYTNLLQKYLNNKTSTDFVIELLTQAAGVNDSELGKFLFASAMKDMENVVVLLDGIDEVSPYFTSMVLSFIKQILEMGVSQIWITSRPLTTNVLEKELCVLPYTLQPFTIDNQVSFLEKYWTANNPQIKSYVKKEFAARLIQINTHNLSEGESQFMGIPLQARMMAEMFERDLKTFNEKGDVALPEKINLIEIFEKFVQFKYDLFTEKKMKIDLSNVAFKSTFGKYYKDYDQKHAVCSLAILVPESDKRIVRPKEIWNNVNEVIHEVEREIFRIGIIDGVMSNKPHFIHRSFAEYFCALWIMGNYKQNKKFLSRSLCQPEFHVMWRMLNYMICERYDLHMAVLNNDIKKVKELLDNKIDVDQQDEYGRTALHLASYYNHRNIAEELLTYGANLYKKDVLRCSPLDYAERSKSWGTANLLLYNCKNAKRTLLFRRDKLILLKDNITEPTYGISALLESAQYGYTELARYLQSHGLDILNAKLNAYMQTALHIAVKYQQNGIIDILLDELLSHREHKGKRIWNRALSAVKNTSHADTCNTKDIYEYTSLMYAVQNRDVSLTEKLILHGANVNARSRGGTTALHLAIYTKHSATVECLLRHGADVNIPDTSVRTPLQTATICGHLSIVKHILENQELLVTTDSEGRTLLHFAAGNGHVSLVDYLCEGIIGIDIRNKEGKTALHFAVEGGHLSAVECLLRRGTDINIADNWGRKAIHVAAILGHLPIVKYLVEKGNLLTIADSIGSTLLHFAAGNGHVSLVDYLCEENVGINERNKKGETALYVAAEGGYLSTVKCLLSHGADVNVADNYGCTSILHVAAFFGHLPIVKYLVEHKQILTTVNEYGETPSDAEDVSLVEYSCEDNVTIDIPNKDGRTALHLAAAGGHLAVVEYLLRYGADINMDDNTGQRPLHIAVSFGHLSIVKYFVENEAVLKSVDYYGNTELHLAAEMGQMSLVEYLCEENIEIDVRNKEGKTALHIAAELGRLSTVEYLLRHGADINIADNRGSTPMHLAAFLGHVHIIKHLVEKEELLTIVNSDRNTALHAAAYNGQKSIAEYLCERNIGRNVSNVEGTTASHIAAEREHLNIVKYLFRHDADINIADSKGYTPMQIAAFYGHLPIVKHFVENGAILTTLNSYGHTVLHSAAYNGHVSIVEYLCEENVGLQVDVRDKDGKTALYFAAERGHLSTVQCLLRHGADINVSDNSGRTPIHVAAFSGHISIVKHLSVENKALFTIGDSDDNTALHAAAYNGHVSIVEYLCEENVDVDVRDKDGKTALYFAAERGHLSTVQCLLRHGADVNVADNSGCIPIHVAAFSGHFSIVKHLLVENEALFTSADSNGDTALHAAAYNDHVSIVEYLCEENVGLQVDVRDKDGKTALYFAAERGHLSTVQCLLRHGADINVSDNSGRTPIHVAAFSGHFSIVKHLLVENEALFTIGDSDGDTALHAAAYNGHVSIVEYLCKENVEVDVRNNDGKTALYFAAEQGHLYAVQCLLRHGADVNVADNSGRAPIHVAAFSGHFSIVKHLVKHEAPFLQLLPECDTVTCSSV